MRHIFFAVLIKSVLSCQKDVSKKTNQTIWFTSPAKEWQEGLPLGNGRLGLSLIHI